MVGKIWDIGISKLVLLKKNIDRIADEF